MIDRLDVGGMAWSRSVSNKKAARIGSPWVPLLVAVAAVWLAGRLYPPLMESLWRATDFRNWTRQTWFGVNVAVLMLFLALRSKERCRRSLPRSEDAGLEQEPMPSDETIAR
jgi:hypothetical protein